ncbi:hypothetical protein RDI58_001568 [Solanum bulbocastanum]|uniref:Uncharacterized protein n=1 Tax=Solanum bulbocastanum TaxID=147425 RepID=A0AAN8U5B8_SOLBU
MFESFSSSSLSSTSVPFSVIVTSVDDIVGSSCRYWCETNTCNLFIGSDLPVSTWPNADSDVFAICRGSGYITFPNSFINTISSSIPCVFAVPPAQVILAMLSHVTLLFFIIIYYCFRNITYLPFIGIGIITLIIRCYPLFTHFHPSALVCCWISFCKSFCDLILRG